MYYGDVKVSDVVAFVRPEQDSSLTCGTAYGHVVVFFGYLEDGKARGLSYSGGYHEVESLADLEIRNQVSSDHAPEGSSDGSYGWSVEYRGVFSANLERVENMAKVLRKVSRSMEKQRDASGSPATFGQYVARALQALGIKQVVILKPREWPNAEDNRLRVQKPGRVVDEIDHVTRRMARELTALAA
jgi:hypothetical protein